MLRLASFVLAMSKPLAGVNSPAVVFGKVPSAAVTVSVGSRPASSWAQARLGTIVIRPARSTAPIPHNQARCAAGVAGRIRDLRLRLLRTPSELYLQPALEK